jgi:hypothetical protein
MPNLAESSANLLFTRGSLMKRFLNFSSLRLAGEIVLLVALLWVAFTHNITTKAAGPQAPEVPDAFYWYVCNPTNHVAVFTDRVHIYCQTTTPVAGAPALNAAITWFAVATAPDSAAASRFMSLLQTSVITARPIWILLDPNDTSGSSFGCGSANCRRIIGMEMR